MRKEFEALAESLKHIQMDKSISIALTNLESKITEFEKRLECARRSNQDSNSIVIKMTENCDDKGVIEDKITYGEFEVLARGVYDVDIALNFKDNQPIQENWYGLFGEPKKEEPKVLIPKGAILEWKETIKYYSAKKGARARVTEDYTTLCDLVKVEFLDDLSNGQVNGGYYGYMFKDEPIKETPPTSQCRNQHTFDKVKEVIQILKTLDNGDCVDGETMDYIVKELGFEEYLLRSLVMNADFKETKDLLREKFEVQI
jgi:hypothetical protein